MGTQITFTPGTNNSSLTNPFLPHVLNLSFLNNYPDIFVNSISSSLYWVLYMLYMVSKRHGFFTFLCHWSAWRWRGYWFLSLICEDFLVNYFLIARWRLQSWLDCMLDFSVPEFVQGNNYVYYCPFEIFRAHPIRIRLMQFESSIPTVFLNCSFTKRYAQFI